MPHEPHNGEPSRLTVGDRWYWTKSTDHDPALFTLTYAFVNAAGQIAITATDGGNGQHVVDVPSATTAGYAAGDYTWQSYLTEIATSERESFEAGTITVGEDLAAQTGGYDARSHAQIMLDAIEALNEGRATSDQLSLSIGDTSISRMDPDQLMTWRDYYQREVDRQEREEARQRGESTGDVVRMLM